MKAPIQGDLLLPAEKASGEILLRRNIWRREMQASALVGEGIGSNEAERRRTVARPDVVRGKVDPKATSSSHPLRRFCLCARRLRSALSAMSHVPIVTAGPDLPGQS